MQNPKVTNPQTSDSAIHDIMAALTNATPGQLPVETIKAARSYQDEIEPKLIELVATAIDNARSGVLPESDAFSIALYLLAEFETAELLRLLMDLLMLPGDGPYDLLCDGIGEDVPGILATLITDEIDEIDALLRNTEIDRFVRWSLANVYLFLVRDKKMTREHAVARLEGHLQWACDSRDELAIPFATSLSSFGMESSLSLIERAFELNLGYGDVSTLEYERECIQKGDEHFQASLDLCKPSGVEDVVKELSEWSWFRDDDEDYGDFEDDSFEEPAVSLSEFEPLPTLAMSEAADQSFSEEVMTIRNDVEKVGRNQPCPCSSGKKFKKCCGAHCGPIVPPRCFESQSRVGVMQRIAAAHGIQAPMASGAKNVTFAT